MIISNRSIKENRLKDIIKSTDTVNISVDGWSDDTNRCFNRYMIQFIDSERNLQCVPFAFEYVKGSHTGAAIKKKYENICQKFGLANKVFKIVADQGYYYYINQLRSFVLKMNKSIKSNLIN